jgi:hypothetical protein
MSSNTSVLNAFTILGMFIIFVFSFLFSMWQTLYFHCIFFDGANFFFGLVFKLLEMGAKKKPCTPPSSHKRKKMGHPMHMWISLWLHENSIPKTFSHHFWLGLIILIRYPLIRAWVLRPTFTLGVRAKKTWGQLWAFWLVVWPPKLLITAKTLTSRY